MSELFSITVHSLTLPSLQNLSLSAEYERKLKDKLKPDYLIYNHFARKFDRLVEAYGREKMAEEVNLLRKVRHEKITRCKIEEGIPNTKVVKVRVSFKRIFEMKLCIPYLYNFNRTFM